MKRIEIIKKGKSSDVRDLEYWLSLTPSQRLECVDQCVLDYLKLHGKNKRRLRRVFRIIKYS